MFSLRSQFDTKMKPRTLKVTCLYCIGQFDCWMDEEFGEGYVCPGCKTVVSVNFDHNTIEVDVGELIKNLEKKWLKEYGT